MSELKQERYGSWTIRVNRSGAAAGGFFYEYKIELNGQDISNGWISAPYGSNKDVTVALAKQAIDTHYKNTVLISEHGAILRWKDDQFRGGHFS